MVIARNSRNFQRSPFGKTGGVVCRRGTMHCGITSAHGGMVKMVKRRKWKSASERSEEGSGEESSVKSPRTQNASASSISHSQLFAVRSVVGIVIVNVARRGIFLIGQSLFGLLEIAPFLYFLRTMHYWWHASSRALCI